MLAVTVSETWLRTKIAHRLISLLKTNLLQERFRLKNRVTSVSYTADTSYFYVSLFPAQMVAFLRLHCRLFNVFALWLHFNTFSRDYRLEMYLQRFAALPMSEDFEAEMKMFVMHCGFICLFRFFMMLIRLLIANSCSWDVKFGWFRGRPTGQFTRQSLLYLRNNKKYLENCSWWVSNKWLLFEKTTTNDSVLHASCQVRYLLWSVGLVQRHFFNTNRNARAN